MTIENCHYTLKIRGRSIGSQVIRSQENRRIVYLESKLKLQGSLDEKMVKQSSRLYRPDFHSLYFREENQDKGHKRSYEVRFDRDEGLVKVFKDGGDNATAPYILPYQDPLGLLYQLRFIPVEQEHIRIPMLGRDVTVRQLPEVELELADDIKLARVFELHPGGSLVYIDSEAPHNILKLNQRIGQQVIEAELESFDKEEGYLNDDVRHSNKRNRSRSKSSRGRSGKSGSKSSKSRERNTRGRSRGRNSSRRQDSSDAAAKSNTSASTSKTDRSKSDKSRPDSARTDGSSRSSRPSRSKSSRNAPRSRRDSYQRSHKRTKPNDKTNDKQNNKPKDTNSDTSSE